MHFFFPTIIIQIIPENTFCELTLVEGYREGSFAFICGAEVDVFYTHVAGDPRLGTVLLIVSMFSQIQCNPHEVAKEIGQLEDCGVSNYELDASILWTVMNILVLNGQCSLHYHSLVWKQL